MKKYLILKGCAGLGNRLITLTNAIEYAKKTNRILYVDWSDGQFAPIGENAFYKYFKLRDVEHIKSLEEIEDIYRLSVFPSMFRGNNINKPLYEYYFTGNSKVLNKLSPILPKRGRFTNIICHWRPLGEGEDLLPLSSDLKSVIAVMKNDYFSFGGNLSYRIKEGIVIFADYRPAFSGDVFSRNLQLNDFSKELVYKHYNNLINDEKIIGVHVRSTDKQPHSTIESLFEKINSFAPQNYSIFLSTDNSVIEGKFRDKYKSIIKLNKTLPKLDGQGLHQYAKASNNSSIINKLFQESLIDMWLLSKCEYLIAQEGSSFSFISSQLKQQPEKTIYW